MEDDHKANEKQQKILRIIGDFTRERGYPPSVREIGERAGLSSSSTVQAHLKNLERKGLLHRDPTKPRAISIGEDVGEVVRVPLVGRVAAGYPIDAVENVEDSMLLSTSVVHGVGCFALRVRGDSMIEAGILDGDLVVVRPQEAVENGQIAVVLIDGDSTVKRVYREADGRVRLQPAHPTMAPLWADDVAIVGRVETVIRRIN